MRQFIELVCRKNLGRRETTRQIRDDKFVNLTFQPKYNWLKVIREMFPLR